MNGISACPFTGKKKRQWQKSVRCRQKPAKGDRYTHCPSCRGIGGNHACKKCNGSGTVPLQRKTQIQGAPRIKTAQERSYYPQRRKSWWD